jgi:signal transduction histidine kinase
LLITESVLRWINTRQTPGERTLKVPDKAVFLDIDAARTKLLLKNLLDNAVRHTPGDAPAPQIRLITDDQQAVLTVTDHGHGTEARHLPHLTEPFYRVDPSRRRETGGYGLGLYLCRMIVEAHDGQLQIESTAGKGTQVTVRLPL